MAIETQKIGKISSGDVYYVVGSADEQIDAFKRAGLQAPYFASPEQVAEIRLSGVSQNWARISMAPIAVKGARTILTKDSPIMNPGMIRLAVAANRNGEYLEIPGIYDAFKQIAEQESTLEPEDRTTIVLSRDGDFGITSDSDEAKFIFAKQRSPYFGNFVPSGQTPLFNLQTDSKKGVVGAAWLSYPQDGSDLNCRYRGLNNLNVAFGVLESGEASAKNAYHSLTSIAKANSAVIPEVLEREGYRGAISSLARPLTKGLIAKLREQ